MVSKARVACPVARPTGTTEAITYHFRRQNATAASACAPQTPVSMELAPWRLDPHIPHLRLFPKRTRVV
jgi:hypothetical protein